VCLQQLFVSPRNKLYIGYFEVLRAMSMNLQDSQTNELLYVGFNQDETCFACGTDTGFRIYNCDPFKETFCREFANGGIGHVEMLFRCNILALVGGGKNPRFQPNKVMIWDDNQNRCIGELSFRSEVKAVRLRRDRVVVVLLERIYVYNFADLKLVDHIETTRNPLGLCALCPHASSNVLACPGIQKGHIRVELYDLKKNTIIPAHNGAISCLALNSDGTLLASASEKGTLIRVFDTHSGNALQELRRGASEARIYCIAFSLQSEFLAVSSSNRTIHVFQVKLKTDGSVELDDEESKAADEEKKDTKGGGSLSFFKSVLPLPKYFTSEFSFAKFQGPEDVQCIVAFGQDKNTLIGMHQQYF
jgi:WD40 repeat protein